MSKVYLNLFHLWNTTTIYFYIYYFRFFIIIFVFITFRFFFLPSVLFLNLYIFYTLHRKENYFSKSGREKAFKRIAYDRTIV